MCSSKASVLTSLLAASVLLLAAPGHVMAQGAVSDSAATDDEQAACKAIINLTNLTITQAEIRKAKSSGTPYCYVRGITSGQAIGYHVQLPLPRNWKGRFVMMGDSGDGGVLQFFDEQVAAGNAVANTNMGHDEGAEPGGDFAWQNDGEKINYAYRAVHVGANAVKTIIKAYYGTKEKHSYFQGCSTGGREAFTEAQRYPYDFDGIVAGDAVFQWLENNVQQTWFLQQVYRNNFASNLAFATHGDGKFDSITKVQILAKAVMDKCDAIDGIKDGIIDDPTKCHFDPDVELADKMCKNDVNADSCFTKAQLALIKDFYRGVHDSRGNQLYYGKPFGFEASELPRRYIPWKGNNYIPGMLYGQDRMNYFFYDEDPGVTPHDLNDTTYHLDELKNPPEYAWWNFNVDDWANGKAKKMTALFDVVDPNLKPLLTGNNGKMLIYHGWIDGGPSPFGVIDYYKNVVKTSFDGDQKAASDRIRLFMVPGMAHCAGGPGANAWDKLQPMIDWVENGKAPDSILAKHLENGKVTLERPLCPYPQHATYIGPVGGENDPANWTVAKNFACR